MYIVGRVVTLLYVKVDSTNRTSTLYGRTCEHITVRLSSGQSQAPPFFRDKDSVVFETLDIDNENADF